LPQVGRRALHHGKTARRLRAAACFPCRVCH
jgi:hypothetical protein